MAPKPYTVKRGDNLSVIARGHKLGCWQELYHTIENAKFRELRPNPVLIHPGDVVMIPERNSVNGWFTKVKWASFISFNPVLPGAAGPCYTYHLAHRGLKLFGKLLLYEDSHGYEVKTNCHQCRVVGRVINAPKNPGNERKKLP